MKLQLLSIAPAFLWFFSWSKKWLKTWNHGVTVPVRKALLWSIKMVEGDPRLISFKYPLSSSTISLKRAPFEKRGMIMRMCNNIYSNSILWLPVNQINPCRSHTEPARVPAPLRYNSTFSALFLLKAKN